MSGRDTAQPERKVVLVTGASAGIGAATARAFGKLGHAVALGARREDRLRAVAAEVEALGGVAFAAALDVADAESIAAWQEAAEAALGPADVLVSNAGMSGLDLLPDTPVEQLEREIAVNLVGPMLLARRLVPGMRARKRGDLLFVTSENAVRPRPYQAGYSAAKAGLEAAARVIGMELEGTGVRSMIVRVGPTGDTEFGDAMDRAQLGRALRSWQYWGVQRHLHWMTSDAVAAGIVRMQQSPVEESYPREIEIMPGGRFDAPDADPD